MSAMNVIVYGVLGGTALLVLVLVGAGCVRRSRNRRALLRDVAEHANEIRAKAEAVAELAGPWRVCSTPDCEHIGDDALRERLGERLDDVYAGEDPEHVPCGGIRFHYVHQVQDVEVLCGHTVDTLSSRGVEWPPIGRACGVRLEILEHEMHSETLRGLKAVQGSIAASYGAAANALGASEVRDAGPSIMDAPYE